MTVLYCAAFTLLGRAPFMLGEMVSIQMPHQHRILEVGDVSHYLMWCSIHQDSREGCTCQSKEDGRTISISRPENQHEWGGEGIEMRKWICT